MPGLLRAGALLVLCLAFLSGGSPQRAEAAPVWQPSSQFSAHAGPATLSDGLLRQVSAARAAPAKNLDDFKDTMGKLLAVSLFLIMFFVVLMPVSHAVFLSAGVGLFFVLVFKSESPEPVGNDLLLPLVLIAPLSAVAIALFLLVIKRITGLHDRVRRRLCILNWPEQIRPRYTVSNFRNRLSVTFTAGMATFGGLIATSPEFLNAVKASLTFDVFFNTLVVTLFSIFFIDLVIETIFRSTGVVEHVKHDPELLRPEELKQTAFWIRIIRRGVIVYLCFLCAIFFLNCVHLALDEGRSALTVKNAGTILVNALTAYYCFAVLQARVSLRHAIRPVFALRCLIGAASTLAAIGYIIFSVWPQYAAAATFGSILLIGGTLLTLFAAFFYGALPVYLASVLVETKLFTKHRMLVFTIVMLGMSAARIAFNALVFTPLFNQHVAPIQYEPFGDFFTDACWILALWLTRFRTAIAETAPEKAPLINIPVSR